MDILAESAARITVLAFGVVGVLRALNIRSPRVAQPTCLVELLASEWAKFSARRSSSKTLAAPAE